MGDLIERLLKLISKQKFAEKLTNDLKTEDIIKYPTKFM